MSYGATESSGVFVHPYPGKTSSRQFHDGRAILYYPMSCGRNCWGWLKLCKSLDESKCATPANRRPGDPVIAPAPVTQADAEKRAAGGEDLEVMDWYFQPQEAKPRR
jgi:hypothetical protein